MKKILPLTALLCIALTNLKAQQGLFKLSVLPGHTYSAVNTTHIKEDIDYTGDTAVVNMTKRIGPPRGFEINSVTHADNKISQQNNGPLLFSMAFGLEFSYSNTLSEGVAGMPGTQKTKEFIYGKYTDGINMVIDSISNLKIDDGFRVIYGDRLLQTQPSIHFPSTPLKVGDSFVDSGRINTPGAGLLEELRTKTTYTLTKITNEKAFFDTKTTVSIDMEGRQITMDMKGGGTGKMVYDMGINYPLSIQNNINVSYAVVPMQGPNVRMTGKLIIESDQQNTITF